MKKKVLLLITTSLTFSAAIAAITLSSNNSNLERVGGINEPTAFTVDYSTISSVDDDTHVVTMKSARGGTFRVVVEGAYYQSNSFRAKGVAQDFYVYNIDPIRGINSASIIYFDNYGFSMITSMFSYNEIVLNDVLEGKYQDLCFKGYRNMDSGARTFTVTASQNPSLTNARYFMFNLFPLRDENLILGQINAEAVCFEMPTPVEIGTNSGALTEDEIAGMKTITNNSLNMSDVGNGSFFFDSNNILYQLHKTGEEAPAASRILANDFEATYSAQSGTIYQKKVNDTVHSIVATKTDFTHNSLTYYSYTDEYDYFAGGAEWPADYIEDNLSNLHKNIIPALDSEIIEEHFSLFVTNCFEDGAMRDIMVLASLKEGTTSETIQTIKNSYLSSLDSTKWSAGTYYYTYEDDMLRVEIEQNPSDPSMLVFIIMERIVNENPPTASAIAEAIGCPNSEDIDIISGGENCYYSISSTSSYAILNSTQTDFNNIHNYLVGLGYNYNSYGSASFTYTKFVGMLGDRINIEVYFHSNYINVYYSYEEGYYESFDSFVSLLNAVCDFESETNESIDNAVTLNESNELYYVSSGDGFGVVTNAGDSFIEEFTSESIGYVAMFDGYKFEETGNYLVKFEKCDGYVKFSYSYYDILEFGSYELFNDGIDEYLSDASLDSSLAVKFSSTDGLNDSFASQKNPLCYFGTLSEVNTAKSIFENRIEQNGKFTYSTYLDCYVNVETGFYYKLSIDQDHDKYALKVSLGNTEFEDFSSYNELNLDEVTLLSEFPAFISNEEKNEKLFIHPTFLTNKVTCSVSKESATLANYPNVLISNGFTTNNSTDFVKYNNSYIYVFSVEESYMDQRVWNITFEKIGPFLSQSNFLSSLDEEVSTFLEAFDFEDNFTSSSPAYFLQETDSNSVSVLMSNKEELSAYETYLLNNNFTTNDDSYDSWRQYNKSNVSKDEFFNVTIQDHGTFCSVQFSKRNLSFVSWNDISTYLSNVGFDCETVASYIPLPDDGVGNLYNINYAYGSRCEIQVNLNYDLNSYITSLMSSENFIVSSRNRYTFKDGYVYIYQSTYYYEIAIYFEHYEDFDGSTFDDAFTGTLGTTNMIFRNRNTYFEFTPEESGTYAIYSSCTKDTYGYLYDGSYNEITHDDDSQDNMQFRIERYLTAGTTYYIGARLYDDSTSETYVGTLTIELVTD